MGILSETINDLISLQDLLNDIIMNAEELNSLDTSIPLAQMIRFKNKIINYIYVSRIIISNTLAFQDIRNKDGE